MERATSPVVGVALLVALTVLAATAVGTVVFALDPPSPAPTASFSLTVDADSDRIGLTHRGGDTVAVEDVRLSVEIDGEALEHQPPVPFFAAEGFRSGPTGPFNSADAGTWTAGERGTVALATTNSPRPERGDPVTVQIVVGDNVVATVRSVAT
jgi:flagellin-like protein